MMSNAEFLFGVIVGGGIAASVFAILTIAAGWFFREPERNPYDPTDPNFDPH